MDEFVKPKSLIIVDGLWLLRRPAIRKFFSHRIFIECSPRVRLFRRVNRDLVERGRNAANVKRQFLQHVAPMHDRFVKPQVRWANIVVTNPSENEITDLGPKNRNVTQTELTMTNSERDALLIKRFLQAQNLPGRMRLKIAARWKQISWRIIVSFAFFLKRTSDVVASFLFLVIFSPLFLLIAALIKIEDGGPIFFPQTRVGRFGREFKMWKFRSMCMDAEAKMKELLAQNQHKDGVTFKIKNDPRVTKIGKWLRKFSLDELPQFFNVLTGNMSLVGPRPPVPREVALYTLTDRQRLAIKPGITCFWQIGGRSEIDFSGQVQLDVRYIESQNDLRSSKYSS